MHCRLLKQCFWIYNTQSDQTEPGKDGAPPVDIQITINSVVNIN